MKAKLRFGPITLLLAFSLFASAAELALQKADCTASLPYVNAACVELLPIAHPEYLPEVGVPVVDTVQVVGGQRDTLRLALGQSFVDLQVVLDPPPELSGFIRLSAVRAQAISNRFEVDVRGLFGLDADAVVESVSCWSYLYWADLEGVDLDLVQLLEEVRHPWWLLVESYFNPGRLELWWELPEPPEANAFVIALADPGDL